MHILPTLVPKILSLMNIKNQPNWEKRESFPYYPFGMDFIAFKILTLYII